MASLESASRAGLRAFFLKVNFFSDGPHMLWYPASMADKELKPPKSKLVIMDLQRIARYVADRPGCDLKEMAEILDLSYDVVRKWKGKGWFAHQTAYEIRNGIPPKPTIDLPRIGRKKIPNLSGAVAQPPAIAGNERVYTPPVPPPQQESPEQPEVPENIKISSLRNQIKQRIMMNLRDSQAVSQYAAALKALAGVQDVELEEIYEQEKIIRIYCPAERPAPDEVVEVDPIEY
jgi:hypothetical protein